MRFSDISGFRMAVVFSIPVLCLAVLMMAIKEPPRHAVFIEGTEQTVVTLAARSIETAMLINVLACQVDHPQCQIVNACTLDQVNAVLEKDLHQAFSVQGNSHDGDAPMGFRFACVLSREGHEPAVFSAIKTKL